ncbi:MAG TPA: iron uptake system protein EfeO [Hyphomicrobiales bacterium]|nr:iron uptake system protein EfeO [Hyphomicrobiales bacterium]
MAWKPWQIGGAVAVVVVAAGLGVYFGTGDEGGPTPAANPSASGGAAAAPAPIEVAVTDKACEPETLTVPAGKVSFRIVNKSQRALEWEILKGVMVVDERENIAPGFTARLTTTLEPGTYGITCGLLSNPKGTLTVTGGAPAAAKPSVLDLVGPIAEYKVYVTGEVEALAKDTEAFTAAVKAGKLDEAKALYAPARVHYERIEPIAELFSDLDAAIDSRADDHEKKEADPGFTGFHRIEYGLFARNSTEGLAPFADKLVADVADLQKRIATLAIPPNKMVGGAADLIEEVASSKISGEEDRYSHTDLWDFQANLDGAEKIVDLLRPLTRKADPALSDRIDKNFATVDKILAKYRAEAGGFETYDKLTPEDRKALQGPVTALAEDLARLSGTLGIS